LTCPVKSIEKIRGAGYKVQSLFSPEALMLNDVVIMLNAVKV